MPINKALTQSTESSIDTEQTYKEVCHHTKPERCRSRCRHTDLANMDNGNLDEGPDHPRDLSGFDSAGEDDESLVDEEMMVKIEDDHESKPRFVLRMLATYRRMLILVLTPLILAAIIFPVGGVGKDMRCLWVVGLMATFWITTALPLAITAFIPVVAYPFLCIMTADEVAPKYLDDNNFLFIGGLMMAVAVEESNLHERLALRILLTVGSNPRWLLLGFQVSTCFLSMWMSDTATAALMLPIALAIIHELNPPTDDGKPREVSRFDKALLLGICYASNIGGMMTLTGTPTNIVMVGLLKQLYPGQNEISYVTWMAWSIPGAIVILILCWLWILLLFIGFKKHVVHDQAAADASVEAIRSKYIELGSITFYEKLVMFMFSLLVALWVFRKPQVFPGWGDLFPENQISDGTSAMLIVILMFALPQALPKDWLHNPNKSPSTKSGITWPMVKRNFEWGTVMFLGGGYAMAEGIKVSGLSDLLGNSLKSLTELPDWAFVLIAITIVSLFTEFCPNAATGSIFIPLMGMLANESGSNPLYFILPVTLACSYSLMLPVATPCNAIVFAPGILTVFDMVTTGFGLNVICLGVSLFFTQTYGFWLFDFGKLPDWANNSTTTISTTASLLTTPQFEL